MGVSYRGHYGELIILLAWFKSKHTHQTTHNGELPNMTPQRLKAYQITFKDYWIYWPQMINSIIKQFVKERIEDERAIATSN